MSFTQTVKKELTQLPSSPEVLAALIKMNGHLGLAGGLSLTVTTENATTARYIYYLMRELLTIKAELLVHQKHTLSKNRVYTVQVTEDTNQLLDALNLADSLLLDNGVPTYIQFDEASMKDYLRGAFLSSGSISDPEKAYHLEIASIYTDHAKGLQDLLAHFGVESGLIERKNKSICYLSKAEEIADFLTLVGAVTARFKIEDSLILKGMRNYANRVANFESANIDKTVTAAQEVIGAIDWLLVADQLPEPLRETALLRKQHPDMSLKDLAQMLEISKSALNHRLRKLKTLADKKHEQ